MTPEEAAAAGVQLAKKAIHLIADGHEAEAHAVLNGAAHEELSWCSAFLLSAVKESVAARFKRPGQVRWALHAAANNVEDDVLTQVAVVLEQEQRRI